MSKISRLELLQKHGIKVSDDGKFTYHHPELIDSPSGLDQMLDLIELESHDSVAVTLQDNVGKTPLHYAIVHGNQKWINALKNLMTIESINIKDNYGHVASDYAKESDSLTGELQLIQDDDFT